jgi:dTDP-4-dehydrorhamnose reductase
MRVLITGAAGLLGQALGAELAGRSHDPVALDRHALDITDRRAVEAALRTADPDAVVNCAAVTDVDGAETREDEALRVNATAAASVAEAAVRTGARFVFISTDYVFDGTKGSAYVESDDPRPLSAYGRSKLAGERAVGGGALIVRTSWLFGPGGRNFVDTMAEAGERRDQVEVVRDQVGSPTYAPHVAGALVTALEREMEGILHLAGAGRCSRYELAREVGDRLSLPARFVPTTSEHAGRPAPRPAFSALASERPDAIVLPEWRVGLSEHLAERVGRAPA